MHTFRRISLSLLAGVICSIIITILLPGGSVANSLFACTFLITISIFLLWNIWLRAGKTRLLACMMITAGLLRLGFGVFSTLVLPDWGNPNQSNQAGYLFLDAFRRDTQAWELAQSEFSILNPSNETFYSDQYGGLLSLSAFVYRNLSHDAHRPCLILILAALAFTIGIPFFYRAVKQRWNSNLAILSTWLIILYPDCLFFTSSQMREPFVLGLGMMAFWAVLNWPDKKKLKIALFAASMLTMFFFTPRMAGIYFIFLTVLFLLEHLSGTTSAPVRTGIIVLLIGLGIIFLMGNITWLKTSALWDFKTVEMKSGWIIQIFSELGDSARIPFLVIYGITQPVLPAVIIHPTLPFLKTINILRAAGWYWLIPLLFYSVISWLKVKDRHEKKIWAWMILFSWLWILISSARAGGDFWDNPRYRMNMIPILALTGSWAILQARQRRDIWLPIWYLIELVFLGYFTYWYASRYFRATIPMLRHQLPLQNYIMQIILISSLIVIIGIIVEVIRKRKNTPHDT